MARSAVEAGGRYENARPTHASKRASLVSALIKGRSYEIAPPLKRYRTPAQVAADRTLAWKSLMRLARSSAGLCRKTFSVAPAAFNEEARGRAQLDLEDAKQCEWCLHMRDRDFCPRSSHRLSRRLRGRLQLGHVGSNADEGVQCALERSRCSLSQVLRV